MGSSSIAGAQPKNVTKLRKDSPIKYRSPETVSGLCHFEPKKPVFCKAATMSATLFGTYSGLLA